MYKKGSKGWLKHFDFILLDMICLQIAFLLAYVIRHDSGSPYIVPLYRNMAIFMELLDIIVMFFYETLSNVLKRGYFREFAVTVKHVLLVELFSVLYLFTMQEGQAYSRTALYLTGVIYAILTYIVRIIWKKILRSRMSEGNRSLLVVTTKDMAEQVVHNIRENNYERFALSGLVIIDDDLCGTKIAGVPVVANEENAAAYVCREWIDEVFVISATNVPYPYALMEQFTEAGVTVHLNLAKVSEAMGGKKQLVEKVGPYTVLTTSINYASTKQLFMKRAIDIAGGLLGCLLTLLITLFVGPAIYLKSPGPIFFAQERVGKNGKKFKMYKFRSMYMDAEERKAELMKQNRVSDGMMFKLDFDPRVIGNEILPDGTKKTGIGNFIRVTSLDEFPQFFNVLKGDMSIVGTRPPTLDEWNKYELHHRARLAIKPGMDTQMLSNSKEVCKEPLFLTMSQDQNLKLLYIGRFEKRRNIHFILDVFSQVINKEMNATLYMIGTGDKDYIEDCWKYAESKNIKNYIVYQEKMEQKYLAGVYGLADFFLLPTEYEIFGMVLLEAMYYHSVVLTTLNGGSSTLIDNGRNGYILKDKKASEWANVVSGITSEKMIAVKEAAHNTIDGQYTWDKLADSFVESYKKLGKKRKG